MPVEGQWRRAQTPLNRRDKRLIAVLACLAVAGIAAGLTVYLSRPPDPSNAGCVVVTLPGTMGGATLRNCGAAARTFCRTDGRLNEKIATACRRQGYPTARP